MYPSQMEFQRSKVFWSLGDDFQAKLAFSLSLAIAMVSIRSVNRSFPELKNTQEPFIEVANQIYNSSLMALLILSVLCLHPVSCWADFLLNYVVVIVIVLFSSLLGAIDLSRWSKSPDIAPCSCRRAPD